MYEHVTRYIDDIERLGFDDAGGIGDRLTHALYDPEIVDVDYRHTLDSYGLEGERPWAADIETLDLRATVALLTFVHRADHFIQWGFIDKQVENGFVYRILLRLRELDGGPERPSVVGFWKESDWLGCCSNWHPSGFEFAGNTFPTAEHWMMWQKANVMGDLASAEEILRAPHPRKAKEIGAKVTPYDGRLWDDVREQLVYYGVREKFLQNERERNVLLSTGSALLAEASPYDSIWGIGLSESEGDIDSVERWRGSNLLGRVCMRVRSDIRSGAVSAQTGATAANVLMDSQVGGMSLLKLSRIPSARLAVLTYARIARKLSGSKVHLDEWLAKAPETLRAVDASVHRGDNPLLTSIAWDETVSELALLMATKKL